MINAKKIKRAWGAIKIKHPFITIFFTHKVIGTVFLIPALYSWWVFGAK
jgi:hypothetical protein